MKNTYQRVNIAILLAALAALAGCEGAVSMQQGGPNINTTSPEPLIPEPLPEPVSEEEGTLMEKLIG